MITFDSFVLNNGLKVIVHEDKTTPLAAVNLLYDIGASDEDPRQTGFAHLFEHLMFSGSRHVDNFDKHLQLAGGESNAFTNSDITNYYDILPVQNIETAFWLESDRLMNLNINQHSLDVQKRVVIEEFKEHYLNQPYGEIWHRLLDMSYKVHPYRWPTIGLEISHIEHARLEDVQNFFSRYYRPRNCTLVVAGNVKTGEVEKQVKKWFGDIPDGTVDKKPHPEEPEQTEARLLELEADVPLDAIYKTYHMAKRTDEDYYLTDFMSDVLSNGSSARLYQRLVREKEMFTELDAYVTSNVDAGLLIIDGKLRQGVPMKEADEAIKEELNKLKDEPVPQHELQKVKNKVESYLTFSEVNLLNKAVNLAFFDLLWDADMINHEIDHYINITPEQIQDEAHKVLREDNCSTLHYYSTGN